MNVAGSLKTASSPVMFKAILHNAYEIRFFPSNDVRIESVKTCIKTNRPIAQPDRGRMPEIVQGSALKDHETQEL